MSRAALLDSYLIRSCALVLAFFRRQNGQAFSPSLPIAAPLSRSWRWADSKESKLGYCDVAWPGFYRRSATGLAARRSGAAPC